MIKTIEHPSLEDWSQLCIRPQLDQHALRERVEEILSYTAQKRDEALYHFSEKFDSVPLSHLKVSTKEFEEASEIVKEDLKEAILQAHHNIETFHQSQIRKEDKIETMQGVTCWRKPSPIERVGLYVPGGTAPLFSTVLMLATPAIIAGCTQVSICTPPNKQGEIHPAILYAAQVTGVKDVYKVGGAQAIAAMAYGTETIPKSYKIFGPGNQYVTMAKQIVQQQGVAIDMPAGPSELLVIADHTAIAEYVAADLLSQAEHGTDSQVVLIATHRDIISCVEEELRKQLTQLPRSSTAKESLKNSFFVVVPDLQRAMVLSNSYAPEHLILAVDDPIALSNQVINAGSVFLGHYSCESAGDYASGTNHTLPTNGYARAYSGVSLDSFLKQITFQHITTQGIQNIGRTLEVIAENEQLAAHKNAVSVRLKGLKVY